MIDFILIEHTPQRLHFATYSTIRCSCISRCDLSTCAIGRACTRLTRILKAFYPYASFSSNYSSTTSLNCIRISVRSTSHRKFCGSSFATCSESTSILQLYSRSIKIVFKWLMRCFSGHLPPTQLLNLWDLVIGYDSLHVIPLLAVTILSFRKTNLLEVDTMHNVEVKML